MFKTLLLLVFTFGIHPVPVAGQAIDLTEKEMYVRVGFESSWLTQFPEDTTWLKIPPSETGSRPIRVKNLNFHGLPKYHPFSLVHHKPATFTFVTQFTLTEQRLRTTKAFGLYLASIGINWEVYVNGHLCESQMHVTETGVIETQRAVRDELIAIDPRILRAGPNILAFKIVGDPTYSNTGFYLGNPYQIDDYEKLLARHSEIVSLILLSLYFFVGLYHLLLFARRPKERYNLFFGLYSALLSVYLYTRTCHIFETIANTEFCIRLELAILFTLLPIFSAFLDTIISKGITRFTIFYSGFCGLLVALVVPTPLPFTDGVLKVWQMSALLVIFYIFTTRIVRTLFQDFKSVFLDLKGGVVARLFNAAYRSTFSTVAGNLCIGIVVLSFTTIFDILNVMLWAKGTYLTRFGFFVFITGIAVILANKFLSVHKKMEGLNVDLVKRSAELEQALKIKREVSQKLQRAQRMEAIGTLAGGIAHDFNNILWVILGNTEMCLRKISDNNAIQKKMQEILGAANRGKDLVEKILTFSQRDEQEFRLVSMHLVIDEALQLLRSTLPPTIKIKQDIDRNCGSVLADETQIYQIFMNLCTNAYHAMEENGGILEVCFRSFQVDSKTRMTYPELQEQNYVELTVSDTGCGMSKETIERIFDPFFTTKKVGKGTGLGLATVHGIVTGMGGVIKIHSELGKGSTFRIYLPQHDDFNIVESGSKRTSLSLDEQKTAKTFVFTN